MEIIMLQSIPYMVWIAGLQDYYFQIRLKTLGEGGAVSQLNFPLIFSF
jgi:hypothetical protein